MTPFLPLNTPLYYMFLFFVWFVVVVVVAVVVFCWGFVEKNRAIATDNIEDLHKARLWGKMAREKETCMWGWISGSDMWQICSSFFQL